ncbi:MAG: zinc ribbon domain-containing protein [Candidatus Tectomicrobia bacterium]|nr:zinc ribbon domain-containing protein [Candidatus Tectomicrobia bacterium]
MPIYEYRCEDHGHTFEVLQKIDEKLIETCKFCSGKAVRVISRTGFILKGSGFYVNDYPSESRKVGMKSDRNGGGGTEEKISSQVEAESHSTLKE